MQENILKAGAKVILADDLLATGGSLISSQYLPLFFCARLF